MDGHLLNNKDTMDKPIQFKVGAVAVYGKAILAPMDGYSDLPFRVLARELGSAMSYSEFINAKDIIYARRPGYEKRLEFLEEERPVVYQIYDEDPERMIKAAIKLQERGADILDVNMGCPAKSVSARGAGSGLLKSPEKIAAIFKGLTAALNIPITGKIRLGWDDNNLNYLEIARIIEDNGGKMLAVHGRTRLQGYRGEANWEAIAEIKRQVSIPVIGNGNVRLAGDIQKMMDYSGCDGVMIGRAARLNPWMFSGYERWEAPQELVYQSAKRHLDLCISHYSADYGLILFRKFIKSYTSIYDIDAETRLKLVTTQNVGEFYDLLEGLFSRKLTHQKGIVVGDR
ncbi:MAG: tRNA-dihydrouridine synthase [Anaerolineae bacterium]|nr:tRNA-dihydrouridine synthase [Anaerolineae bacterium]